MVREPVRRVYIEIPDSHTAIPEHFGRIQKNSAAAASVLDWRERPVQQKGTAQLAVPFAGFYASRMNSTPRVPGPQWQLTVHPAWVS